MTPGTPQPATPQSATPQPATPHSMFVTGTLRASGAGTAALLGLFIVAELLLAIPTIGLTLHPWLSSLGFIAMIACGILIVLPAPNPYPLRLTALAVTLIVLVAIAVTWNMPHTRPLGYIGWHWGGLTFLLFVLAIRGRIAAAWVGFGLVTVTTVVWTAIVRHDALNGINLMSRHAGILVIATVFALALRQVGSRALALDSAQRAAAEQRAAATARFTEMRRGWEVLDGLARPVLEVLANDEPLSSADRRACENLEAQLRDRIRGSGIITPNVEAAVRAARDRGTEVVLLDDRGTSELESPSRERLEAATVAALQTEGAQRVTVRLLPKGRENLATIVIQREHDSDSVALPADPGDGSVG